MTPEPQITAEEIIAAMQTIYPKEFQALATVIVAAKKSALSAPKEGVQNVSAVD